MRLGREDLMLEIGPKEIVAVSSSAKISNNEYVASYNWVDSNKPEILVPGAPARWQPPQEVRKLEPDRGLAYIDENAARYYYPMEPAMRAVLAMNPGTKIVADVITCRNSMKKLHDFIMGKATAQREFQIDVEIIGGTAVFVRQEPNLMRKVESWHYPAAFKAEYTEWEKGVEESTCHIRVNRFKFAGLTYLLRHECDGYVPGKPATAEEPSDVPMVLISPVDPPNDANQIQVSAHEKTKSDAKLKIRPAGKLIGHDATIEIKTRVIRYRLEPEKELSHLWSSQTPNLVVAHHDSGRFNDVEVHSLAKRLDDWEAKNSWTLCKLDALIRKVVNAARGCKSMKCRISKPHDSDKLQIYELDEDYPSALPADLRTQLEGRFTNGQDDPMDLSDEASSVLVKKEDA